MRMCSRCVREGRAEAGAAVTEHLHQGMAPDVPHWGQRLSSRHPQWLLARSRARAVQPPGALCWLVRMLPVEISDCWAVEDVLHQDHDLFSGASQSMRYCRPFPHQRKRIRRGTVNTKTPSIKRRGGRRVVARSLSWTGFTLDRRSWTHSSGVVDILPLS